MNIFKFELGSYKKSILIWALSVPGFMLMYLAFYPTIASSSDTFNDLMASFPEELLSAFGMNTDLPMTSILGFFGVTYSFILIPIAIQASNYGFHMLSVEERELTADFLLSKPVKRGTILLAKFGAAFISLMIVNIALWITAIVSIRLFAPGEITDWSSIYLLLSTIGITQMFFVSVAMMISVAVKKVSSVLSFSMALAFGMYIIQALNSMMDIKVFSYITPFSHFDYSKILTTGKLDFPLAMVSAGVIVVSLTLTYFLYNKRNISSL